MRRLIVVAVAMSGWVLTGSYIFYDYMEYGVGFLDRITNTTMASGIVFHFFIIAAPLMSAVLGFLVNERIKLLGEVRDLEKRYRDYYEHAPCGYQSVDREGTIVDVNETWLRMLGYEREKVIGRMNLSNLIEYDSRELADGDFLAKLEGLRKTGAAEDLEARFVRSDGTLLPVMINSTAVLDEGGNFLRSRTIVDDITERKRYEDALRAGAEEWRTTFDSMPWGVMLLDKRHNVIRSNEYMSKYLGMTPEELSNRKCYELVHGLDAPLQGCAMMSSMATMEAEMTECQDHRSGRHFRLYCRPLALDGSVEAFVHSMVDITDIRKGERKLLDSRNAFFNMLKDVSDAYKKLNDLYGNLVLAFANAIDAKSHWTKGHSERVSRFAVAIAREMGLKDSDIGMLKTAALLHDIGKIGTYDYLLDKPEGLTKEEFDIVKQHPINSARILEPIHQFKQIIEMVRYHHERMDGSGYPDGLKGEQIPLLARILCVADAYDSMTADRPYRPAPGEKFAVEELNKCAGTHFDAGVVSAFIRVRGRLKEDGNPKEDQEREHGNSGVHR